MTRLLAVLTFALVGVAAYATVRVADPTPDPPPAQVETASSVAGNTHKVEITFFAAWDNSPHNSTAIAHPVLHSRAGGTGSFSDPLTFASPEGAGAYRWGTRIYVPIVRKYYVREDACATSWTAPDGCGPVSHVDLYMGNPSVTKAVLACEDRLTPPGRSDIVVNPPDGLTVDPVPLWDQKTGVCHASSKS